MLVDMTAASAPSQRDTAHRTGTLSWARTRLGG